MLKKALELGSKTTGTEIRIYFYCFLEVAVIDTIYKEIMNTTLVNVFHCIFIQRRL